LLSLLLHVHLLTPIGLAVWIYAGRQRTLAHLRQLLCVFADAKACHESFSSFEFATTPSGPLQGTMLRNAQSRWVKARSSNARAVKKLSNRRVKPGLVLQNSHADRFFLSLDDESAVGNESRPISPDDQCPRFAGKSCQVIPIWRMGNHQRVQLMGSERFP
jgi:hypothetical protein